MMDKCWLYPNPRSTGYGRHREVYEVLIGPIPPGLDLDHTCRVRACYNPRHLEPVTRAVNLHRGATFSPETNVRRSTKIAERNNDPVFMEKMREAGRRGAAKRWRKV